MPSHPTLFDDEGSGSSDVGSTNVEASTNEGHPSGGRRNRPNYLVRRAIVVAAVVVVVAAAASVVGWLIGRDDDGETSGEASADWDQVVVVDERSGDIMLLDAAGDTVDQFPSGVRSPAGQAVVERTAVIAGEELTAIVDLDSGEAVDHELGTDRIVTPAGTTRTMLVAASGGGRGLLVHGPTGDVIDTDEFADVTGASYDVDGAISDPSGRHVLVADTGNFQSVLFSFDRDEPSYFPGLALAVDDDTVVTAQNVGNDATIAVFDHDGEPRSSGRTPTVRAALLTDDAVYLVTVDGVIVTMALDSGETDDGITLPTGTVSSGTVLPTGDRLVVVGAEATSILDVEGDAVGTYAALAPLDDEGSLRGSVCVTLRGTGERAATTIVDAVDGDTVATVAGAADRVERSADGCTIAVGEPSGGYRIVGPGFDEAVTESGTLVAIAPDAAAVVVEEGDELTLSPLPGSEASDGDEPAGPVTVGLVGDMVFFSQS